MEARTKELDQLLTAIDEWAILDEEADIVGIKEDAPDWAKKALMKELESRNSIEPIER